MLFIPYSEQLFAQRLLCLPQLVSGVALCCAILMLQNSELYAICDLKKHRMNCAEAKQALQFCTTGCLQAQVKSV